MGGRSFWRSHVEKGMIIARDGGDSVWPNKIECSMNSFGIHGEARVAVITGPVVSFCNRACRHGVSVQFLEGKLTLDYLSALATLICAFSTAFKRQRLTWATARGTIETIL